MNSAHLVPFGVEIVSEFNWLVKFVVVLDEFFKIFRRIDIFYGDIIY